MKYCIAAGCLLAITFPVSAQAIDFTSVRAFVIKTGPFVATPTSFAYAEGSGSVGFTCYGFPAPFPFQKTTTTFSVTGIWTLVFDGTEMETATSGTTIVVTNDAGSNLFSLPGAIAPFISLKSDDKELVAGTYNAHISVSVNATWTDFITGQTLGSIATASGDGVVQVLNAPEPSELSLLAICTFGLLCYACRGRGWLARFRSSAH